MGGQLEYLSVTAHHEVHAIEDPTNPATLYWVDLLGEGSPETHNGRENGLSRGPQILAHCDPALPHACTASSLLLPPQRHALHGHDLIQYTRGMTAAWTAGSPRPYDTPMPAVNLSDYELRDAARACRALAHQEQKRAEEIENPDMRRMFAELARHYRDLAARLERARAERSATGQS